MATELIHDRGRGPEIVGTRVTVYNLMPQLLDASVTEDQICRLYDLTPEQVAAARAYVLSNPETVLAEHLKIEARLAEGNSPAVIDQARQTRATFLRFKEWLARRQEAEAQERLSESKAGNGKQEPSRFPTFHEWLAVRESERP
jgi:uncharacterized protein (DUF433 family)